MMTSREYVLEMAPPGADARLRYGPNPLHFGDLRLPGGTGPHPVVVMVHGGFWRARFTLEYAGHLCAALAALGVATWNVEYRRLGDAGGGWPGTLLDVAAAADHLCALAAPYHLDLSRVVALGHSAGGHLALWLAARRRLPANNPLYSPAPLPLTAVVALAGVADLQRAFELGLSEVVVRDLLGGAPTEVPERYAVASPAALLPLGLPQVIVHGTADEAVPFEIGERFCVAARAAGDAARLLALPGAGHFEPVDPRTPEWSSVVAALLPLMELAVS